MVFREKIIERLSTKPSFIGERQFQKSEDHVEKHEGSRSQRGNEKDREQSAWSLKIGCSPYSHNMDLTTATSRAIHVGACTKNWKSTSMEPVGRRTAKMDELDRELQASVAKTENG